MLINLTQLPEFFHLPITEFLFIYLCLLCIVLSATIAIDIRDVAQHDLLYSFIYTDAESETLNYNYSITPAQPEGDNALFQWDTRGNYFGK